MISLPTWILWVHILAAAVWLGGAAVVLLAVLPAAGEAVGAVARRAHFLTSRAIEVLVVTGILNILGKGMASGLTYSAPFFAMLSVKMALLVVMAGLQIWMGLAWKRAAGADPRAAVRQARLGLSLQCILGATAALLGLGLRAV